MSSGYDECLDQNPFFQAVCEKHNHIIQKATEENWIICVPRIGTIDSTSISTDDILEHILVPNLDLPNTHFSTLTKREITIQDKFVIPKGDEAVCILFDETCYTDKHHKYKLLCIERPLHRCLNNYKAYTSMRNIHDCIKLLWSKDCLLDDINRVIEKFLVNECEFDVLEVLQQKVSFLYKNCIEVALDFHKVQVNNANLAVETYMQHCIHHKLFSAICNYTWQADADFNKIYRNVSDIQLKDLEINIEFLDNIVSAKRELSNVNKFSSALGKVECLRRVVDTLTQKNQTHLSCITITTDDLLKIFVFLVIKSNLNNWIGNLMYITHFRFSSMNLSDENCFLITTLEAAIEYIKSGTVCFKSDIHSKSIGINSFDNFFACVKDGNLEAVKDFFDSKGENILTTNRKLCCHPLCSCDKCDSVVSFSVNSSDDKGCTALHIACMNGQPHIVEYLISKSAKIDVLDYSESIPLHYAALTGDQNALLLLLHADAQIDTKNCNGNTPLHLAANNGHESCVKALLYFVEQKGTSIDINSGNNMGDTALHFAVKWGYISIVHILLQYGANIHIVNKRSQKVFDIVHNSYIKKIILASNDLKNNILPNQMRKSIEDVRVCPKNFHQLKKTNLALKAIENNDLPLMCYYLGIPTPLSTKNLNISSICHPLCTCDKCLKHFENSMISTPEYSKTLNINTCNSEGYSPLHVAAKCGRGEILRLLLDSGALVNVETYKHQQTPLHLACKNQRIQIVRELLQCGGCNLDIRDAKGNTPLHYACLSSNHQIVELLLSHGSDFSMKNLEGKTPLQEAKGRMLFNIVSLLNDKSSSSSDSSEDVNDLFSF